MAITNSFISFASDNYGGVHPEIFDALHACNVGHAKAYGGDTYTDEAVEIVRKHFGEIAEILFVINGTGANILALQAAVSSFQSILCAETAHINTDECGAIEKILSARLVPIKSSDGKLTPELVKPYLIGFGDQHRAQPRVISISQATEYGTLYQPQEIARLVELAHAHNMIVHVDGSRLSNAAVALNTDLRSLTTDLGVDVVSFGGTKNGLMFGEAVVFLRPELAFYAQFYRKQIGQLLSKHRFVAAQFIALMKNDLYRRNAAHANAMAARLAAGLTNIKGIHLTQKVECNVVFAQIPHKAIKPLQNRYAFYVWNEQNAEIRWMTAFDTKPEHVDDFLVQIAEAVKDNA